MISLRSLLLPFLGALATASPLAASQKWECYSFQRACASDGSTCTYDFGIAKGPFPDFEPKSCKITIPAAAGVTAAETSFADIPCPFSEHFHVNGGWDPVGRFMTLVVTDVEAKQVAYFGFTEAEMADGNIAETKQSPPLPVGQFSPRASDPPNEPIYVPEPRSDWEISLHNVHRCGPPFLPPHRALLQLTQCRSPRR